MNFIEENCTITHEGKSFTSGGAIVSDNRIVAYPAPNGILNDWHGNPIGRYSVTSSRPAIFFGHRSWQGDRYYYMRAKVDGKRYSLRGFGEGMIATGKRIRD